MKSIGDSWGVRIGDVGSIMGAAFQLVGAGFGGAFGGHIQDSGAAGALAQGTFGLRTMPLLVPVLAAVAVWLFLRLRPLNAGISAAQKTAIGIASGAVFATGATIFAAVTPFRVPSAGVSISTAGVGGWVVAFLAVALFVTWRDGGSLRLPRAWAAALSGAALHFGVLILLAFVAIALWLALNLNQALAAVPFWGLSMAIWATVLAMFGSVGADLGGLGRSRDLARALGDLPLPGGSSALTGEPFSVLSPFMPGWAPLLILVALAVAVFAGVVIYVRGGADGAIALARTAVSWLVVGLMLSYVSSVAVSVKVTALSIASVDVSGSFGPTATTFLVLVVWGVVAGAAAVWLAPHLAGSLPARLVALLQRGVAAPVVGGGVGSPTTEPSLPVIGGAARPMSSSQPPAFGSASRPVPVPAASAYLAHPSTAAPSAAAAGVPGVPGVPVVAQQPLSPRAKRGLVIGGVVAGVLIVAAVVLPLIRSSFFGPESVARAYMSALESGHAEKAVALAPVGNLGDASRALLTDAAYQAATDRPSNFGLGHVSVNGDIATMDVTYGQGGVQQEATLTATRAGTAWLIADQWRLTSALPAEVTSVSAPGGPAQPRPVTVNGVDVGTLTSERLTVAALPGTYQVKVAGTDLLEAVEGSFTAGAGGSERGFVVVEKPTEAFAQKAKDVVTAQINACAARTDYYLPDTDCPFSFSSGPSLSNQPAVTYTIEEQPVLSLTAVRQNNGATQWSVVSTRQGRYSYTYTSDFFGSQQVNQNNRTFTVRADLKVAENGDITISAFR